VEIVATDTVGNSRSVEHTSFGSAVAFHLKQGGNGAAFGKYSEDDDCLDCLWDAKFHGNVEVDGDFTIRGNKPLFTGKTLYDMGMLDLVYPVGAVYISTANITPATIFGGSWTAISGKFLLSTDSSHAVGTTGGEEYKTLQPANLPVHSHGVTVTVGDHYYSHSHVIGADKDGGAGSVNWSVHGAGVSGAGYQIETSEDSTTLYHNVSATVGSTGEGQSFSIMPPYLSVYMWQRTA
jgi:microcystin-dependent protein